MPRRTLENRNVRKLYKNSGGSVMITLPIELVRNLKWRDGQKVVVSQKNDSLIITDWKA